MSAIEIENTEAWFLAALSFIGNYRGAKYAAKNPVLIAAFMQASAISYHADRQVEAAELIADAIKGISR